MKNPIIWILLLLIIIGALVLIASYVCFLMVFKMPKRKKLGKGEYDLPPGEIYEVFYPQMKTWIDEIRAMNRERVEITSFDGLNLAEV